MKTSSININDKNKVPILAIADDIVLLGEDERESQCQVDTLYKYLKSLGISISRERSQAFQVVAIKDTGFVKDPKIKLEKAQVSTIDPEKVFRYLGAKMGAWKDIHCGIIVPEIMNIVRKVRKLSFKPYQKIE